MFYDHFVTEGWDLFIKLFLVYMQEIQFDIMEYYDDESTHTEVCSSSASKLHTDKRINWKRLIIKALDFNL